MILSILVLAEAPLRDGLTKSAGLSCGFAWEQPGRPVGVWL